MINKYTRWINQNIGFIVVFAIIIVLFFMLLNAADTIAENLNEEENATNNVITNTSSSINNMMNKSVLTQENLSDSTTTVISNTISTFVKYCNNGNVEEAYNMLTDECKELIFPSLEYFNTNYYERIFYIYRTYNLESWYNTDTLYTYYITYTEDALATGNTTSDNNKGDYITVVAEENGYKLNIYSYVGREYVEKTTITDNDISIKINWIDMYMDYVIINLSTTNNTENNIILDTKEDTTTTYLYDTSGVTYTAFLNENSKQQLLVRKGNTNTVNIKFHKIYNTSKTLSGIVFSEVVLNYDDYTNGTSEKESIKINVGI